MSQVFSFQDHPVRTVTESGQTWFVGKDIATLLGYTKTDKEIRRICKHVKLFKGTNLVPLGNSPRGFLLIPEADVWRLIVRSTLDKALEIEEWIMGVVLPTIRKTGKYEAKPKALPGPKQKALPAPDPAPDPAPILHTLTAQSELERHTRAIARVLADLHRDIRREGDKTLFKGLFNAEKHHLYVNAVYAMDHHHEAIERSLDALAYSGRIIAGLVRLHDQPPR